MVFFTLSKYVLNPVYWNHVRGPALKVQNIIQNLRRVSGDNLE